MKNLIEISPVKPSIPSIKLREFVTTKKTNKDLLRRLHVKYDGKIYSGAEAFIVLWNRMPKFKFLGKLLSIPIIFHIFSLIYEIVAFFLYLKNRNQLKN